MPTEEPRLDLYGNVRDRKHTQILLSTFESSPVDTAGGKSQLVLPMVKRGGSSSQASSPSR